MMIRFTKAPLNFPRLRHVTLTATRLIQHPTRPSLGTREGFLKLHHCLTLPRRAQKFPSATYFSIGMSKAWSTTSCFSRRFSSSSFFSRTASSDFIPLYWLRQRLHLFTHVERLQHSRKFLPGITHNLLRIVSVPWSCRHQGLLAQSASQPS